MDYARNKNCLPIQLSKILLAYLDEFLLLTSCQAHHYPSLCLWRRERNHLFCFVLLMQQSGSFAVKCKKKRVIQSKINHSLSPMFSNTFMGNINSTKGINSSLKFCGRMLLIGVILQEDVLNKFSFLPFLFRPMYLPQSGLPCEDFDA